MSATDGEDDEHSCELGKLSHWEQVYEQELRNLETTGDEGEIWFGKDVMQTMVDWVDVLLKQQKLDKQSVSVLDVGTGNGVLLLQLAKLGFQNLIGSDYSAQSIMLANKILQQHQATKIRLVVDDLLSSSLTDRFDVITDKGTLDAVGLMEDALNNRAKYKASVWSLLQPGGLLVITSCNSTQQELQQEFEEQLEGQADSSSQADLELPTNHSTSKACFQYVDHVQTHPKFKFGGVEGSRVCTLAFRKI